MADLKRAKDTPKEQLYDVLEALKAGMLRLEGSKLHSQPMAHQLDREGGHLIFFTEKDSALAKALTGDDIAHFTIIGEDQDYHACMSGAITTATSPHIVKEYWSPVVGAWFEGPDDPRLAVLVMSLKDASIWASTDNSLKFGWEIAKAHMSQAKPDVGIQNSVTF